MPADHFARFFPATCAGFGLLLAGGVNLLLVHRGFALRVGVTLAVGVVAVATAAAASIGPSSGPAVTAMLLILGLIPFLIFGSRRFVAGLGAAVAWAHRSGVRCALLASAGVATVVGSIVAYEQAGEADDDTPPDAQLLHGRHAAVPAGGAEATTDLGTVIVLKEPVGASGGAELAGAEDRILHKARLDGDVIRRGAADDRSNCHGWIFTGGRFLLSAADVELILRENGYGECRDPRPGDLVVYRRGGAVLHTAVVRYVAEGQPVMVEGKWGDLGVFLHAIEKSVYGTDYTFHRSARVGHLLAGAGGPAAVAHRRPQPGPAR